MPNVPLVALTATADKFVKKNLEKALYMQDPFYVSMSPNKDNIRISATRVDSLLNFEWLVKKLLEKKETAPFTIIFCNTLHDIARLLTFFLMKLGKEVYIDGDESLSERCLLGVFHSGVFQEMKDTINTSFKDLQGATRVVFATSSLGMGVNYPEVEYVIHYGPARSIVSHLQEAGRAGRNGEQAHNIIYYEGKHLVHCDRHIKNTLKSGSCLRVGMYNSFDDNIQPKVPLHLCCSNCHKHCDCCNCPVFDFERETCKEEDATTAFREITSEDRSDFKEALFELQTSLTSHGYYLFDSSGSISHGFSLQLIVDLTNNLQSIYDLGYLISKFPFSCVHHAICVLEIVQELFHDVPEIDQMIANARSGIDNNISLHVNKVDSYMLDYFEIEDSPEEDEQQL